MKKFTILPLIAALAFFVSCQKQQTEEEKRAEVERQVQDRLAAERVQDEKQRLAQEQANLEAREKALADRESAAAATPAEEATVTETAPAVRERSETRSSETRSTAAYGMFYRKLEPHGAWRETADYGYVWQPRQAEESRDWRPYTEGRWVYSDAGWTWVSDEPFGWATYHYGRWLRLRRVGWVWVPGDEWAPAWVSWRTSKDYVGWAPLPPEARFDRRSGIHAWADSYYDIGPDQYSFVPNNEFSSEHVRRSVVPAERNVSIVIDTTNVTNITYANTTIVNEGPNYEEMRTRSRRPIERYRLRRQSRADAEFAATVRGDELEVSVPLSVEVRDMPRPRTVKERVIDVTIDTGWTAIADHSAAERARTRMRADATPPPNAPPKKFVRPQESAAATPAGTAAASAASATPVASATTTPASTATPNTTPVVRASAAPASTATPSATPVAKATTTPVPTAAAAATATPLAKATATATPVAAATTATPVAKATATATPVAVATATASATPAASATPRMRPSPSSMPKATPAIAPSVAAPPSATPAITPSVAATATPRATPPPRMRPSPSIAPAATPMAAPAATPMVTPALSPATTENTPPIQPQRRVPPPRVNTPPPAATPSTQPESIVKPRPSLAPVKPPTVAPQPPVPTPAIDTAPAITPSPNAPRRMPPRPAIVPPTPALDANPSAPPVSSAEAAENKPKNLRPRRPDETPTPSPTPTPTPAVAPPN